MRLISTVLRQAINDLTVNSSSTKRKFSMEWDHQMDLEEEAIRIYLQELQTKSPTQYHELSSEIDEDGDDQKWKERILSELEKKGTEEVVDFIIQRVVKIWNLFGRYDKSL